MVTIVDPHVKRDSNYYVYKEASEKKYFVRTKDNTEFDGWCWPGVYLLWLGCCVSCSFSVCCRLLSRCVVPAGSCAHQGQEFDGWCWQVRFLVQACLHYAVFRVASVAFC
jgi:hypothetical protein